MSKEKLSAEVKAKIQERLDRLAKINCIDAGKPDSRPTKAQQEVLDDYLAHKYKAYWTLGGNQCKPGYSRILMADNSVKPIEDIQIGDMVKTFDFESQELVPTQVVKTYSSGVQDVYRFYLESGFTDMTLKHKMIQRDNLYSFSKIEANQAKHFLSANPVGDCDACIFVKEHRVNAIVGLGTMLTHDFEVDHPDHNYICDGYISSNSGKSALLRKVFAWFLAEGQPDIPYKRRPEWEGPLQSLLVSKNHKQLTESILPGILKFFGEDEIKVVRNANYVEKLIHRVTGNTVICAVHENAGQARERVQSFTLHLVGLDELPSGPSAYKLVEELQARVMLFHGCLFSSFTPKSINKLIKEHVESALPPHGKKYTLRFVDNPAADAETISARLQQIANMPEHVQKTLLEGTWAQAESTVYQLTDYAIQGPLNYSPLWRHVVGVDPGLASAQGVVIAAEDPTTGRWYIIHSEAFSNIADVEQGVQVVADLITKRAINVTKIIYDAAGTYWYMGARKHPILSKYKIDKPWNKNSTSRREDMISAVQTAIGATLFVAPWNEDLIEEFGSYHWSESVPGQIVKSQKYHLLDALRYLVDGLPKWAGPQAAPEELDWPTMVQREIRQYNQESRARAAARRVEESKPGNWRRQNTSKTWRGSRIQVK